MPRGPIFEPDYKPQFSGHETFPLRYGWLKKAFDAVVNSENVASKGVFAGEDAVARFGVGKNMVSSIRHWAGAANVISELGKGEVQVTQLGRLLFGQRGVDPYMENPASLWLAHWHLAGRSALTTWYWVFSYFPGASFDRAHVVSGLSKVARDLGWRASTSTIKRDVECFVRTYVARPTKSQGGHDDSLESPLTELGLIRAVGARDGFRLVWGEKSSLSPGVFAYAIAHFWSAYSSSNTLSFEAIAHEPGSPGRVFLLTENELIYRLTQLEDVTKGAFRWSETAGLKQLIRTAPVSAEEALNFVKSDFRLDSEAA